MKPTKAFVLALMLLSSSYGEEGMWPYNMIPKQQIQEKYGVTLDEDWIQKAQKASLRMSAGGSASFVSKKGLVMTNHHVGAESLYNLSTADQDFIEKGFYAKSYEEELKCPNLYVDQLISIQDVTQEVNQNIGQGMNTADREKMRKAAIASIKKKAEETTHLQPEVVMLYQGARYHLYLYKRYSDVRLVMAPEKSIASLGGDTDNFEYPRYNLDMCFFRVYENNQPLNTSDYFKWSKSGPKEGEVLFVSGNPGRTERMYTSDHLRYLKDFRIPMVLDFLNEKKGVLESFSKKSKENKRIALKDYSSVMNARKVYMGIRMGFQDLPIIPNKEKYELGLYKSVDSPEYAPWSDLKEVLDKARVLMPSFFVLEGAASNYCKMYVWARDLVRYQAERLKPNEVRLKEYVETELPALELDLLSEEPVYLELEKAYLISSFERLKRTLGENHPSVKIALAGETPAGRAEELIKNTKLMDVKVRQQLYTHPEEIVSSQDALLVLARMLDDSARSVRSKYEDEIESVVKESYTKIAKIIFDKYGESVYPDATFTLRLSMGKMEGYKVKKEYITPTTTIGGAYLHAKEHHFVEPFALPPSWIAKEGSIHKDTPFNFVSTNDIIGGNSGSPVINAKSEIVGLIFDGNKYSLIWDQQYDEVQGRAISVHSQGMLEALKSIYQAERLLQEIQG